MRKAYVIVRREIDQRLGFGQLAQGVVVLALLEFGLKGFWQFHDYKYKERRVVFSPDGNGILFILFAKQNKKIQWTAGLASHKKTQPFARLGFYSIVNRISRLTRLLCCLSSR